VRPFRDYWQPRGVEPTSPSTRPSPRGVRLTFEAHSARRIDVSGSPIPLRPLAGPWGLPSHRRPRSIARPTRLAPVAFAPPPGFSLEAARRASRPSRVQGRSAQRASLGVPCPSAHHGLAGPLIAGLPISPLRSALRVSTLPTVCSPRALPTIFQAGALLGFALQGFAPPGPSVPLTRPVTPTTLKARQLRTSWRPGSHRTGARPASPSSGLTVPGVRSRRPVVHQYRRDRSPPGLHPSWGPSASRRAAPIWRPSPPGLPDGFRTCVLPPPRPSGVFDDERPSSTPGVEQPLQGSFPIL
jgi:hypothetical protein